MTENECPNFAGLFTTKVVKSHVKLHVKSDAQKVNSLLSLSSQISRDRAEGGAEGALAPPLFCKNKNKLNTENII